MSKVGRTCGICARNTQPIQRVYREVAYCVSCYARLFTPAECHDCGHRYRYLKSESPPPCPNCARLDRTCLRCAKAVPRASLTVEGGVACPSCARYFKQPGECPVCHQLSIRLARDYENGFDVPVCERCRRKTHVTCAVCQKHRKPAGANMAGKVVCKRCLEHDGETYICPSCGQPGVRHSASRCLNCYWGGVVQRRQKQHRSLFRQAWVRDVFDGFVPTLATRIGPMPTALRMERYALFFTRLDACGVTPEALTEQRLCEIFGMDGLRRFATPFGYLVQAQVLPPISREALAEASARQTWQTMVRAVEGTWYGGLMQRYLAYLESLRKRYHDCGWVGGNRRFVESTITGALRAARQLLQSLSEQHGAMTIQQLDQGDIDHFLLTQPGYRHAVRRFVFFLRKKEKLFRPVSIESSSRGIPLSQILPDGRYLALLREWLQPDSDQQVKESLIGVFMLLYAQTAKKIVRIQLQDLRQDANGSWMMTIGRVGIALEPRASSLLDRYLVLRRAELEPFDQLGNPYLFPGRNGWSHFTEGAITYQLQKREVSANQLFATAIYKAYQAGLRHPKVLVQAFGITTTTAVKYLHLMDARLNDEANYRLNAASHAGAPPI